MQRATIWLIFCLVPLAGCGRKTTPVDEVSLGESGIEVTTVDNGTRAEQWPGWRGPNHNGVATDQPVVTSWDDSTNIRWRSDIPGRGHSSPVVVGDTVYLTTAVDDQKIQVVMALNRSDGTLRWSQTVHERGFPSPGQLHKKGTNANSTVACDGERVFAVFLNAEKIIATALSIYGDVAWQKEVGAFNSKFGYAPSPILYKSLVIIAADNWGGGYLAALDGKTGEIAWRVARPAISTYSSPVVATVGGKDQLLISGCNAVTSFNPETGEQLWQTAAVSEATCGTIVASSDRIFASGGYPERETVCLSPSGERLWSNEARLYEPSMILAGENLMGVTDDGIAHCWSAETGELRWRERLGGNFSASPILCNRQVYVSNLKGETFVFSAAGTEYELIAKNKLGSDCYASPAAADGELYLRIGTGEGRQRREQLVCIAAAEREADFNTDE